LKEIIKFIHGFIENIECIKDHASRFTLLTILILYFIIFLFLQNNHYLLS